MITVSKVLRDKPDVSAATRKRVLQRVEELGYRPNLMARGLASGRTHTIGLIVPNLVDMFFAELATSLGALLRGRGYQVIFSSADEDPKVEAQEMRNLLARGVDALLLASCRSGGEADGLEVPVRVPFVLIDRALAGVEAHFVGTDDVRAGALATEHLIGLGRTRIGHIGGTGVSTAVERLQGFRDALAQNDRVCREGLVVLEPLDRARNDRIGREAMDRMLEGGEGPDAVFCYNDLLAVGAIRSALGHGLRVPEDVAIIGCGNLGLSSYLEVPLSSIDQRTAELGARAGELAVGLIEGEESGELARIVVSPKLVARASTVGARAADAADESAPL